MLRPGTVDDSAAMADIFNYYVATSDVIFSNRQLTPEEMRRKLVRLDVGGRFPFFIATSHDGKTAGYGYAHLFHEDPVYDGTWELTIYLDHNHLGEGIGGEMLHALVEECRRRGAYTLISCVTGGNKACERMHIHEGFHVAGCLKSVGFKFGRHLDDVFFQIVL